MKIIWHYNEYIESVWFYEKYPKLLRCLACRFLELHEPLEVDIDLLFCPKQNITLWNSTVGLFTHNIDKYNCFEVKPDLQDDYHHHLNIEKEIRAQCGYGAKVSLPNHLELVL